MAHGSNKYRDGEKEYAHLQSDRRRQDAKDEVQSWQELRDDERRRRIEDARAWYGRLSSGRTGLRDAGIASVIHHVGVLLQEVE